MKKLLIVQPVYAAYRDPLFKGIKSIFDNTVVICQKSDDSFGFVENEISDFYKFTNWGTSKIKRTGFSVFKDLFSADIILHVGDFKFSSLWVSFFLRVLLRKKVFLHGQGGYKKSGFIQSLVYNFALLCTDGYVCYNDYCAESLESKLLNFLKRKVSVVNNTLYLPFVEDSDIQCCSDIFYIGRLREGCGIEILLEAAYRCKVKVRIVGSSDLNFMNHLKINYPNNEYHGVVYDIDKQRKIAKGCIAGAYGGDAGLSVVHYMAFGLPVIVHNDIGKHMGPEPTYVENGVNGLIFNRGDVESLASKINQLKQSPELQQRLSEGAIATFKRLQTPPMHEKFAKILGIL